MALALNKKDWRDQVWAVWGMGVSGSAAVQLLLQLGVKVYAVNSGAVETWPNAELLKKLLPTSQLINQDTTSFENLPERPRGVILSPGIPRDHAWIAAAANSGVLLWNEMELAYRVRPLPILAITGTNGKTTTTTLLGHILQQAGKKVFVGGNIGKAYCQGILEEVQGQASYEVAVIEASSFQLESLFAWQASHSAIINITPSHGERYHHPYDYARAKANLILLTEARGKIFVPAQGEVQSELLDQCLAKIPAHDGLVRVPVQARDLEQALGQFLPAQEIPLLGVHNWSNTLFACRLAQAYGISPSQIAKAVRNFQALHHRCEPVVQKKNLLIVNDSKSTNWDSTLTALQALQGRGEVTLVIGGKLRGRHDEPTPEILAQLKKLAQHFVLFGEAASLLAPYFPSALSVQKLDELSASFLPAFKQGVLLFSPAFPSFDHYKNYEARGEHFCQLVRHQKASL